MAELEQEIMSTQTMESVLQHISETVTHQQEMQQHSINLDDRVEEVWQKLHMQDTMMVALVGMGGIGIEALFLLPFPLWIFWHP